MKKMLVMSFILSLVTGSVSFAAITGQVRDTNQAPVSGAAVTFISESDAAIQYTATTDGNGYYSVDLQPTAVHNPAPESFTLGQNYPNPFNPTTTIPFTLEQSGMIELTVYSVLGQKVRTLVAGYLSAGSHTVTWNCLDDTGHHVGAGIYLYRLISGGMSQTHKMLLLDGGASGLSAAAKPAVSFGTEKPAEATFRVNITGEGIADFGNTGLSLADGQRQNFTVFPSDGMIVNTILGGSAEVCYINTLENLDPGRLSNTTAYETLGMYAGVFIYQDMVFVSEDMWGDTIYRYDRQQDGSLELAGSFTRPPGAASTDIAFVDETKAFLSLEGAAKILVINPTDLTITNEIDVSEYAVGEDDFNPEPTDMVIRDGKLFVALRQAKSMYVHAPAAYMLIVDVAAETVDKMISDPRTMTLGWYSSGQLLFVDDAGDLYVAGVASYGMNPPEVHPGILRIKHGETEFDPDYFFDLTATYLPDVPGNLGIYMYANLLYTGGSTVYTYIMIPALMSDPPDYVNDRPTVPFKLDLVSQTAEKIDVSPTNSYGIGLCGYDNKIVFGMTTVNGDGLYTYDPKTGATSSVPAVTTEGLPIVLKTF